ncbi:MAG: MetQ/NlpA family ABC transporter substrate-binding protein [Actinomycetaceae bacterium]|nr:MetQ/NlpA family ABC transporter substrate-binding protein [Actinomycetaceae bacterium]
MRITKKIFALAGAAALTLGLSACGGANDSAKDDGEAKDGAKDGGATTLIVGATPTPHGKILKFIQDELAEKEGLTLDIKEYTDYVLPNEALQAGDIDANYFQHVPYIEQQIADKGFDFEWGKGIHLEPLGLYSDKLTDIKDIKEGASIGIINDPSNQARGLKLLSDAGLLKIPADKEFNIAEIQSSAEYNPKKLQFKEVEGPQLIRSLADVDAAVINGNFALEGGKEPKDALQLESATDNPNSNILAWKKDSPKLDAIKKLDALLHSDEVKQYIEKEWPNKAVIPAE